MSHSFVKISIHAIWATKLLRPLLTPGIEKIVYDKMYKEFKENRCPAQIINGMPEHVHCLFSLGRQISISQIIKQVKGASSRWLNEEDFASENFEWQVGYAAYSVSESQLQKVYRYIKNQKQHHKKVSFETEYDEYIQLHGLQNENEF